MKVLIAFKRFLVIKGIMIYGLEIARLAKRNASKILGPK